MKNILVVDDLPDALSMLSNAVTQAFQEAQVVTARSLREAKMEVQKNHFDLALVDLNLSDGNGQEIIQQLSQQQPECMVVVATIYDDDDHLFQALHVGAQGYLLKDQGCLGLVHQLQGISEGRPPLSPPIARRLLKFFHSPSGSQQPPIITAREREVLGLLAQGYQLDAIGASLNISRHTVGDHVKNIYRKLNINSRAEAALRARGMGLI